MFRKTSSSCPQAVEEKDGNKYCLAATLAIEQELEKRADKKHKKEFNNYCQKAKMRGETDIPRQEDDCAEGFVKACKIAESNPLAFNYLYTKRAPTP